MNRPLSFQRAGIGLAALVLVALSACSSSEPSSTAPSPVPSAAGASGAADLDDKVEDSQFTVDGTYQSHIEVAGVDFVYTLYPTKSTPRTNEWYPQGDKYFTVTLTSYDLDRQLRDPFESKRLVYLEHIEISSDTDAASGDSEEPYSIDAPASQITFDPEPLGDPAYGMLITSPKGSFELRNQAIGTVADDTTLVTLTLKATVWIQRGAGNTGFDRQEIRQEVPIAIFESDTPTKAQKIPFNAN